MRPTSQVDYFILDHFLSKMFERYFYIVALFIYLFLIHQFLSKGCHYIIQSANGRNYYIVSFLISISVRGDQSRDVFMVWVKAVLRIKKLFIYIKRSKVSRIYNYKMLLLG